MPIQVGDSIWDTVHLKAGTVTGISRSAGASFVEYDTDNGEQLWVYISCVRPWQEEEERLIFQMDNLAEPFSLDEIKALANNLKIEATPLLLRALLRKVLAHVE